MQVPWEHSISVKINIIKKINQQVEGSPVCRLPHVVQLHGEVAGAGASDGCGGRSLRGDV